MFQREFMVSSMMSFSHFSGEFEVVPYIRLDGEWLKDLGFVVGERVIIEQRQGELILRPEGSGFKTKKKFFFW